MFRFFEVGGGVVFGVNSDDDDVSILILYNNPIDTILLLYLCMFLCKLIF
jgi:hypothetical protein